MGTLEDTIMQIARPTKSFDFSEGALFFLGIKKVAEDLAVQPDAGQAPVASPFTVPTEQAVDLMAQMVANEFKTQVYYIFYAHTLRGLARHAIAEEFLDHAKDELEHATYLLRRIGVLSPGGVAIPSYPPPEPSSDPADCVQKMIVVEEMGLSLWKQLHSIMGDNVMKYSIEQFLQREEEHMDELWQLVEQMGNAAMTGAQPIQPLAPEASAPPPAAAAPETKVKVETSAPEKLASIFQQVQMRKQASEKDHMLASLALAVKNNNTAEISRLKGVIGSNEKKTAALHFIRTKRANFAIPAPGMDSPEQYMEREQQLSSQAAIAEAAHAKAIAMQTTQAAQQAQSEAQAAKQQAAELQAQLEQQTAASQQASAQAMQSQQQAAEAEARAAEHSISKMQLGMRMNQVRQELANLVMQDPVAESAATVSDLAAQGQPATPQQQMEAEQQQAMGGGEGGPPTAEAQQQAQEADSAQQHAEEQTAEAQQAAQQGGGQPQEGGGPPGAPGAKKDGTSVTVKTSGDDRTIAARPVRVPGVSSKSVDVGNLNPHLRTPPTAGGALSKLRGIASHSKAAPVAAAALGVGALGVGAGLAHHAHKKNERANQAAKTASPADRRLIDAIAEGGTDTLSGALRGVVGAGRRAASSAPNIADKADAFVNQGVGAAQHQVSTLGERIRPHLPGFVAGAGTAMLGGRLLRGEPQQPQMMLGQGQGE